MMKKIFRILHVGLGSHLGGIETYLLKIAENIDRDIFQFDFIIAKEGQPCYYKELQDLGCRFYRITSRRENFIKNKRELKKLLEAESFDIIHCHQNSLSYIEPVLAGLQSGCKVIVHSRNAGIVSGLSGILHKMNSIRLPKDKICCAAVSDKAGEWMFGKGTEVTILNNGIDTVKYAYSETERKKVRDEFGIGEQKLFLHVGAFRPQKNHEFLIDIFHEYLKADSDALLLLVGEGALKENIEQKAKHLGMDKNVIFAGLRSDVPRLLSAADVFLLPSLYEGFPNVLIEAETSGLHCIVSDRITRQACIEGLCERISLEAPVGEWALQMENQISANRENAGKLITDAGLDIGAEMGRLEGMYKKLLQEEY